MDRENEDGWRVEFYDFLKPPPRLIGEELVALGDLHKRAARNGARHATPIIIPPAGVLPDPRLNLFFRVSPMTGRKPRTWRRYAMALVVWLSFLDAVGRHWTEATPQEVEAFKDWRLTDVRNPERVKPGSFDTDRAALNTFYTWASATYALRNPVPSVPTAEEDERSDEEIGPDGGRRSRDGLRPTGARRRQIKWMLRAAFEQWRDIGLRGYGFDGLRIPGWRGVNEDRDAVFVDGLYGTGLRLQEWASVLDVEIPLQAEGRFPKAWLAAACIKGTKKEGRTYRIPRRVLRDIEGYCDPVEGSRTEAIRRAQRVGRYEALPYVRVVTGYNARSRTLRIEGAPESVLSLDAIGPDERRLLFRRTEHGLEPLALWLAPSGMPKKPEGWEDTFQAANERIAEKWVQWTSPELRGEDRERRKERCPLWARPHMCRHSFALRWFSILSLVWQPSVEGFTAEELADLREQFGGIWYALSTLLGHDDSQVTKDIYLEPFTALQVDYLMALLDEDEQPAVDALIRTVAHAGGRTLVPVGAATHGAEGAGRA
ncbi:integrase [Streptomyces olivochromogenes]|uniref:Integrase n=1 Tax=Streptomyces olivochromogenes TaxID=1963 RepID=A0A286PGA6_STROL|nr:integrase [Streptomyces olivochromogenes]KUN34960.1 integrase [Streptomyces olivochromogenes]GAX58585.1 integrase [Streptomyces olivochromogenes]